jgi:DNA-binding CsgD family transcriptional regulator
MEFKSISQSAQSFKMQRHEPFADPTAICNLIHNIVLILMECAVDNADELSSDLPAYVNIDSKCHIRHVAIYLSYVSAGLTMSEIANAFSVDRSTVSYACAKVEDRRDYKRYDRLISYAEKLFYLKRTCTEIAR